MLIINHVSFISIIRTHNIILRLYRGLEINDRSIRSEPMLFFLHGARHKFDSIVSDTNRSGRECFPFDRRPNCRLQFTVALFCRVRLGKYKRRIDSAADYTFETPAKPPAFVCRPPRRSLAYFLLFLLSRVYGDKSSDSAAEAAF